MDQNPEMRGTQPNTTPTPESPATPVGDSVVGGNTVAEVQQREVPVPPAAGVQPAPENTSPTPVAQPIESGATPKKKRTGLIIAIITLVVVLLAGTGVAIWYFCFYNNPDVAVYDAVKGVLTEDTHVSSMLFTGNIEGDDNENAKLRIELHSEGKDGSTSSKLTMLITPVDASGGAIREAYRFSLGGILLADGMIYIRSDDLAKAFDDFVTDYDLVTEDSYDFMAVIAEILETIDGEWWRISVPEVIDLVVDDSSEATAAKDLYSCMIEVANQDVGGMIAGVYSKNRFIEATKLTNSAEWLNGKNDGESIYSLTFDYEKMADFVNALPGTPIAEEIYSCINNYSAKVGNSKEISAESFDQVDANDLSEAFDNDVEIQLKITDWGHELTEIVMRDAGQPDATFNVEFAHDQEVEVSAPSNSRSILNLYEEIAEIILELFYQYLPDGDYGYNYIDPENPWNDDYDYSWSDDDWDFDWDDDWS